VRVNQSSTIKQEIGQKEHNYEIKLNRCLLENNFTNSIKTYNSCL